MNHDINNLPTLKELEQNLFRELQQVYQNILVSLFRGNGRMAYAYPRL